MGRKKCRTMSHTKKKGKSGKKVPDDDWAGLGLRPKQRAFLEAYSSCGSVTLAAEAANVSKRSHQRWKKGDERYAQAFGVAKEQASQVLEDEARRRAVEGVREPVYYEGAVCGHRQRYSDNLLMFLLKANNPEKFRERSEATHQGGGEPIPVDMNLGAELLRKVIEAAGKPGVPVATGDSTRPRSGIA